MAIHTYVSTIFFVVISYACKFSRKVIFVDNRNPGFLRFYFQESFSLCSICILIVLENFKDSIFVDDKLPAKTGKVMDLESSESYGL